MTALTHFIVRRRYWVIAAWIVLTVVGASLSGRIAWNQSASVPGQPAYEASQQALAEFGTGARSPNVLVFTGAGDVRPAVQRALASMPGAKAGATHGTGNTRFVLVYPPGRASWDRLSDAPRMRAAAASALPDGMTVNVTGRDALDEASKHDGGGSSLMAEALIGGLGALVVLLFVFGTLPAVLMPLAVAVAAIMNTFTLVHALTQLTNVSVIVQFLIALVGLGIAIDYALLMITRFRDELAGGRAVEDALVETVTHAGRAVIVSGLTVAIGLFALVALPLPMVRSVGIGGMLIPAVSVLASITLLPALLAVVGRRIDSIPVMPRRLVRSGNFWGRWARFVIRRPRRTAAVGLAIVATLAIAGTQLNAHEAPLSNFPGAGTAIEGRDQLAAAGITPGVMKPINALGGADVATQLRQIPGIVDAQPAWPGFVEAFANVDGADPKIQPILDAAKRTGAPITGTAAIDREFLHVLTSRAPLVLALVFGLTLLLLTAAFRSIVLALKAVVLNLMSLAAAFGVIVLVFQLGHGSALWDVPATGSVTAWVPMMIFAFLFGLSMDYEVFMLSRIREAYDETGSTDRAIELGLGRTGKLVTSAALILAFAFLVLSTSPGYEIKPLAIGVAAGILLDATVVRALLVPALMRLLGNANWWTPHTIEAWTPSGATSSNT
jgi:RND superfamily putative drug exporter